MPRLTKSVPKYRKHKASGQAVVTLDGKDFYLGPHNTEVSRRDYDRLVGEWQLNGRRLPAQSSDHRTTVAELLRAYWKFAEGYYVKNGEKTDELPGLKIALRFVRKSYGHTLARDFGPLSLETVQQQMVDVGHSRNYINKNIGRVKRCFKCCVSKEMVPVEVYQALLTVTGLRKGKSQARETTPVGPVDDATVAATLKHVPAVVKAMVRFQRLTGCRPGELFIMRPCDIDRSSDVWQYTPSSHKTEHHDRIRQIFIGPQAQQILAPYLLKEQEAYCFTLPRGGQFRRWNYADHVNRACGKAFPPPEDLEEDQLQAWRREHRWSPNQLRHAAATEFRRRFGLEAAQVLLGHASADVTQVYAERDARTAAEVMLAVG